METFTIKTSAREEFIDITGSVQSAVAGSCIRRGICVVHVPHTTAGLTVNENADPAVKADILEWLEKAVPRRAGYRHAEGNSDAHIKASLMGPSLSLPVEDGRLVLGIWQSVYLCEFDGARSRQVNVQVIPAGGSS